MSYKKAEHILPEALIAEIQKYISGECLYIPAKSKVRSGWGQRNGTRRELDRRNQEIVSMYAAGIPVSEIAGKYFLSEKTIYHIISQKNK